MNPSFFIDFIELMEIKNKKIIKTFTIRFYSTLIYFLIIDNLFCILFKFFYKFELKTGQYAYIKKQEDNMKLLLIKKSAYIIIYIRTAVNIVIIIQKASLKNLIKN